MRTFIYFIAISFSLALLLSSCGADPKPVVPDDTEMYSPEQVSQIAKAAIPTTEQIEATKKAEAAAALEKEEAILAEAKKAEEKIASEQKEKEDAARKERRRKRREKRKKAAEAAEAKAAAKKEDAKKMAEKTVDTYDQAPAEEDLSNVDPELLDIVQVRNSGGKPNIRFDSKIYDFGRIMEGKEVEHNFVFTNTGSAPLVIEDVKVTCGCTTPFYPFIPIEPGETGKISVHFNSKGRLGNQKPTITVYTNAEPDKYELHLKGVIDTEREGGK